MNEKLRVEIHALIDLVRSQGVPAHELNRLITYLYRCLILVDQIEFKRSPEDQSQAV